MKDQQELIPSQTALSVPESNVGLVSPPTPLSLLEHAVKAGNVEMINTLAALHREQMAMDAKQAYNDAMNLCQKEMGRISTDADNPQTRSKYASYAQLDRALRPIYTRHGFGLSFNTADSQKPEHIKVLCDVSHSGGHTEHKEIDMPCDGKGAKGGDVMTKTHATGAGTTYGMRYLLKMIFNVAIGEDDNDGNEVPPTWVEEYLDAIKDSSNRDECFRYFTEACNKASGTKWQAVIIKAKDNRKAKGF